VEVVVLGAIVAVIELVCDYVVVIPLFSVIVSSIVVTYPLLDEVIVSY
jgi:hypothetical protein